MGDQLFLVGSVPLESADEVFHQCGRILGDRVRALPDGEIGERSYWILFLADHTYRHHPDLEIVRRPEGDIPRTVDELWDFRLKDREKPFRLPALGYAEAAVRSYAAFREARSRGDVAPSVRFQIALPFPQDAVFLFFRDPDDHEVVMDAYEDALLRELDVVFDEIPPGELSIQWDVCTDLLELTGRYYSWSRPESAWDRYTGPLSRLPRRVPEEAELGFHFCYGTYPRKPALMPEDLSLSVEFANAAVAQCGRRVDFVHLTVPRIRTDDVYFRPLEDLDVGDTRVYLGVLNSDGLDRTLERIEVARRYLPDFGIAAECGFGRADPASVPALLELHREVAERVFGSSPG